jgi:menaquinone-dependent protoporphyrinogen oxidase
MSVLVAYVTKHGSTKGIAERKADILRVRGLAVELQPIKAVRDPAIYDAFVIGGAAYMGLWSKDAAEFVRRNQSVLETRPVWLFSSGPLGTETRDAQGRDLKVVSRPNEFAELKVFFGALDPSKLEFAERLIRSLPAGRALLPEGDFRKWEEIEAWAESIAQELAPLPSQM